MDMVVRAGKVCRVVAIALFLPVAAGSGNFASASPLIESASRAEFVQADESSREAISPAPSPHRGEESICEALGIVRVAAAPKPATNYVNPLREPPRAPASAPPLNVATAPVADAPTLRLNDSASSPSLSLRMFRGAGPPSKSSPGAAPRTAGRASDLFPRGKLVAALSAPPPRVMRYEDVARGVALVPVVPTAAERAAAPSSVAANDTATAIPPATSDNAHRAADLAVERLPALDRTAPRPRPKAGMRLPQKPIQLYPETGQ